MQQPGPTQYSAGTLERKCLCKKMKSMEDDASSAHVPGNDKNKIIVKRKAVAAFRSSSASNEETSEDDKIFSCSSCTRKFSSQHAMAGHRNIHRSEWESILRDIPDEGKMQRPKLPCKPKLSHFPSTTIALKQQSHGNSRSTPSNSSSTIHKPLPCAPPYPLANPTSSLKHPSACVPRCPMVNPTNTLKRRPSPRYPLAKHRNTLKGQSHRWILANPTNALKGPPPNSLGRLAACDPLCPLIDPVKTLKGPSPRHPMVNPTNTLKEPSPFANPTYTLKDPLVPAPQYILANPEDLDTLIGSSLGVPHYTFLCATKTLKKPLVEDLTHPLDNRLKPHGMQSLGVRPLSMIHKPCQFKHADMWSRAGSTLFGGKQMMEGNIRHFGTNNNNVYFKSLLTAEGAPSSSPEGGGNSEASSSLEGGGSSEARNFLSLFFRSRGVKGIDAHDIFDPTPGQEMHNCDIDHSSEGVGVQQDKNGENESSVDIDLELKL